MEDKDGVVPFGVETSVGFVGKNDRPQLFPAEELPGVVLTGDLEELGLDLFLFHRGVCLFKDLDMLSKILYVR